ncbi:hypothetical protein P691DRAFT_347000 [Macrolepiota fuliginosa MF-IS2]|uniref:Uncharacterized protein n=1 Tax=Macrolepiota fuliginosa MF-IS2 TaxID=1400762 RepID=A0A9P5XIP7_9AGAR|nr:hypothetical protein P691DRAFT_347000 [Macrolepiota fuliginosa MF-IS2]
MLRRAPVSGAVSEAVETKVRPLGAMGPLQNSIWWIFRSKPPLTPSNSFLDISLSPIMGVIRSRIDPACGPPAKHLLLARSGTREQQIICTPCRCDRKNYLTLRNRSCARTLVPFRLPSGRPDGRFPLVYNGSYQVHPRYWCRHRTEGLSLVLGY